VIYQRTVDFSAMCVCEREREREKERERERESFIAAAFKSQVMFTHKAALAKCQGEQNYKIPSAATQVSPTIH
jgi:hypothetical protein